MSISTLDSLQSVRMLDEIAKRDDRIQRAEMALMRMFLTEAMDCDMKADSELETRRSYVNGQFIGKRAARVGDVLAGSLDYANGPGMDDLLTLLVRSAKGELIQSEATALLHRMAAKWAEMQVMEQAMRRLLLSVAAVLMMQGAHAIEVEASIGSAQAGMPPDGQYWQRPFPHTFNLQGQAASLGVTDTFTAWGQTMRWRVYGLYLGKFTGDANAVQDENYSPISPTGCVASGCGTFSRYHTELTTRGVVASISPEFNVLGLTISPEVGIHYYVPQFNEDVWDIGGLPLNFRTYHYKGGWNSGSVIGLGVSYKNVRFAVK